MFLGSESFWPPSKSCLRKSPRDFALEIPKKKPGDHNDCQRQAPHWNDNPSPTPQKNVIAKQFLWDAGAKMCREPGDTTWSILISLEPESVWLNFPFKPHWKITRLLWKLRSGPLNPLICHQLIAFEFGSYTTVSTPAFPNSCWNCPCLQPWVGYRRTTWPEMVQEDQKLGERHHYLHGIRNMGLSENRVPHGTLKPSGFMIMFPIQSLLWRVYPIVRQTHMANLRLLGCAKAGFCCWLVDVLPVDETHETHGKAAWYR